MRKRMFVLCLVLSAAGWERDLAAKPPSLIIVSDAAGLQAALTSENEGRRIHLLRGTYQVHAPLVVPDGVILDGEGVMLGSVLPEGFENGTETRIVPDASAPFAGDLLTLGHGATIRALIVEDIPRRSGNVVAVHSRAPADRVSASIERCEIVNPKANGAGPDGPLGRGLAVLTRNGSLGAAPPPDEDAEVSVTLTRSIIRSTAGASAIFAINFASRGDVTITASLNRIYGSIEITGGVSRPDEVKDARLTVHSEWNEYSTLGGAPVAWTIDGGSGAPVPNFVAPGTSGNVVRLTSIGDRVEGFPAGVAATAGKRHNSTSGPTSNNVVDLRLIGLRLETEGPNAADLILHGAGADGQYAPGDDNILRVLMVGVSGSGSRQNSYANEIDAGQALNLGTGNRLEVLGSETSFGVLNPEIVPAPPAEFFRGRQ